MATTFPAKQVRSQQTLSRIEETARAMLNEMSWQDVTMAELGRRAGASTGSIYARFASKAALLDFLDERYCEEMQQLTEASLQHPEADFDETLSRFVRGTADYLKRNHGLVRTLILETRTANHAAFHERSRIMNAALARGGKHLFQLARDEGLLTRKVELDWVLFWVLASLRELTLFPQGLPRPRTSFAKQVDEVLLLTYGYLGLDK